MAKKFSTKDVKIVPSDSESEASVESVSQDSLSPDLSTGSSVNQDGKSGKVIWEGHESGKKKIKIKWEDGSMSFHLFE
jgi:hypothetical protein